MVSISRILVEHYPIPLGISEAEPRLSWRFETDGLESESEIDWYQKGYDIRIHGSSGTKEYHVDSEESILVPWPGSPLISREGVKVEIRSIGNKSSTDWTSIYLERGIEKHEWKSQLISCEKQDIEDPKRPFQVRSTFKISSIPDKARLYVTAHGLYEIFINGKKVGDELLAPGWTEYRSFLTYRTHDIGSLLVEGENIVNAWIGEGWFAGRIGWDIKSKNLYGDRIGLLAQIELDGKIFGTDETWEWSYGSIVNSGLYDGEVFDPSTKENWSPVEILPFPKADIITTQAPPVKQVDTLKTQQIITSPTGKTILDFGQNFAGVVRFVNSPPEGTIVLRHAEVLEYGEMGVRPLRKVKAIDTIKVPSGINLAGWQPKFTFHGFRYLEVTGWSGISVTDIEGIVFHSAMERTGHFECSHKLINQLHKNVIWSTIGNTISVPTDCPQRDERLGWTGDIQVFASTLNFLFDSSGFLNGWIKDCYVNQIENFGVVPDVIPNIFAFPTIDPKHPCNLPQAIWGDVAVLLPLDNYHSFGDKEYLKQQWEGAKLWLDKGISRDSKTKLWDRNQFQLADWLSPKADPSSPGLGPTDNLLVADAYLIHTTRMASKIGYILNDDIKAEEYKEQADQLLLEFYNEYVTPSGRIMSDTQTALALVLHFDLFPSNQFGNTNGCGMELKEKLAKRLSFLVEQDQWQVSTGFAGTPIILHVLANSKISNQGDENIDSLLYHAYRMLQARDCPSWLSPILLGATTIWERWDSMLIDGIINPGEMTSFNHYALGSVASFLHSVIGGLKPLKEGWKEIEIRPRPGGTIRFAKVSYISGYGKISCEWSIVSDEVNGGMEKLEVDIEVPPNCTAKIILPGLEESVGSGKRSFKVDWKKDPRFPPKPLRNLFARPPKDGWVP